VATERISRSKKAKKTYSKRKKLHGPGKINKEIVEQEDQEEDMGDEDKENEDDAFTYLVALKSSRQLFRNCRSRALSLKAGEGHNKRDDQNILTTCMAF
jgi:hypothetical protein